MRIKENEGKLKFQNETLLWERRVTIDSVRFAEGPRDTFELRVQVVSCVQVHEFQLCSNCWATDTGLSVTQENQQQT